MIYRVVVANSYKNVISIVCFRFGFAITIEVFTINNCLPDQADRKCMFTECSKFKFYRYIPLYNEKPE